MSCVFADVETWLDKDRIVEEGNIHKFSRCKDSKAMAELLLGTGDLELVEVSVLAD